LYLEWILAAEDLSVAEPGVEFPGDSDGSISIDDGVCKPTAAVAGLAPAACSDLGDIIPLPRRACRASMPRKDDDAEGDERQSTAGDKMPADLPSTASRWLLIGSVEAPPCGNVVGGRAKSTERRGRRAVTSSPAACGVVTWSEWLANAIGGD
jgi:hypothetical protein